MAGKVIDLRQDLGSPPPQSRERLIFSLQMENKLAFKHMKVRLEEQAEDCSNHRRKGELGISSI